MNRTTTRGQTARYQKQPVMPKQPPQTSIRSAQAFNHQQMQPSRTQYEEEDLSEQVQKKSPMTIQKAITLITLRLGAIETKLLNNPSMGSNQEYLGESLGDEDRDQIFERLNTLETKIFNSNSVDYKQSIELLTQSIAQLRSTHSAILKENKELKNSISNLKNELLSLKSNSQSMQQSITEHHMKILELSLLGQSENDVELDNEIDYSENTVEETENETELEINLDGSDIKF